MAWKSSTYTSTGGSEIESGQGVALSSHWFFKDRFAPYFKFGFSNGVGENAFSKKDIQIGHGLRFKRYDMLGASFSWAETNIPDADKSNCLRQDFYLQAQLKFPDLLGVRKAGNIGCHMTA